MHTSAHKDVKWAIAFGLISMHACMLPPLRHFHEYAGTHVAIAMLSQLHNKGGQERASSKGCQ